VIKANNKDFANCLPFSKKMKQPSGLELQAMYYEHAPEPHEIRVEIKGPS
jgi:hypothetical protein